MSLPKQLLISFEKIKKSKLVSGVATKDTVQEFIYYLNEAIPSFKNISGYAVYRFARTAYHADKNKFLNYIKEFHPYDAMVLWTDYQDILTMFDLNGKIFLGWDKNNNRYRGFVLTKDESTQTSDGESPLQNSPPSNQETQEEVMSSGKSIPDQIDNDMDRIYDYMQERLANIAKSISNVS